MYFYSSVKEILECDPKRKISNSVSQVMHQKEPKGLN